MSSARWAARGPLLLALAVSIAIGTAAVGVARAQTEPTDDELIRQMEAEADAEAAGDGDAGGGAASNEELTDEELIRQMEAEAEGEGGGGEQGGDEDEGFDAFDAFGFDSLGSSLDAEGSQLELPLFGESTFSLVNSTYTELRANDFDDDQFLAGDTISWSLTERLELILQGETLRASLRLDAFVPILEPNNCETSTATVFCDLTWDVRPERLNIMWTPGDFNLQIGDSHAVVGRGISLSMRKIDQLGIDNTVRGGYLQYDGGRLFARALGGVANPQNLDPVTLTIRGDPHDIFGDPLDVMVGGELGYRLGPANELEIGGHAAQVWFEHDELRQEQVEATVFGWHAGAPALFDGALALYGEVNALVREDVDTGLTAARRWGRAVYGSAQVSAGQVSVLAQWKDYADYAVAPFDATDAYRIYSAPPLLDRDTERFRGLFNSRGGSLEATYAFLPPAWSLTATAIVYGHDDEHPEEDPWDGILTAHGLLTLTRQNVSTEEGDVGWQMDVTGGYRREVYLTEGPLHEAGDLDWEVIHGEADASVGLGIHSFELRVEQRFERRRLFNLVEYVRGGATLTWSIAGRIHVSAALLWNDEKVPEPDLYPGGEIRWEFIRGSHVRIFVGQQPGGRICAGGICRDVPTFEGGLAEVVLRI